MKYFRSFARRNVSPSASEANHVTSVSSPTAVVSPESTLNILDSFVTSMPSAQNALDIFEGEWSSRLPSVDADLKTGPIPLFEDDRLAWALELIGDIAGKSVLELGPLEGGHSYMLSQAGASVLAIEAQTRCYLKCLIAKETLNMTGVRFMLGDAMTYLRSDPGHFDIALAAGILYHMDSPVQMLHLLTSVADRMYIWTHVWDDGVMENNPQLKSRFADPEIVEYAGFKHTLHPFKYNEHDLSNKAFCGGGKSHSKWMLREDLLRALEHFGWQVDAIGVDNLLHVSGPEISLVASRRN